MGQAQPIRVRKMVRIEIVGIDDIEMTYEVQTGEQLVIVIDMPAFRDATAMQGAIALSQ